MHKTRPADWITDAISSNSAFSETIARTYAIFFHNLIDQLPRQIIRREMNDLKFLMSNCLMGALTKIVSLGNPRTPLPSLIELSDNRRNDPRLLAYFLHCELTDQEPSVSQPKVALINKALSRSDESIEKFNSTNNCNPQCQSCLIFPNYRDNITWLLKNYDYDILHDCSDDLFHSPYTYPTTEPGTVKLLSFAHNNRTLSLVSKKTTFDKGIRELTNYIKVKRALSSRARIAGTKVHIKTAIPIGMVKSAENRYYLLTRFERGLELENILLSKRRQKHCLNLTQLIRLLYEKLASIGFAWRDFSPRNMLVRFSKDDLCELILYDFSRCSFVSSASLNAKWRTLVSIFAREEFLNSVDEEELHKMFPVEQNALDQGVDIRFVDSQRLRTLLGFAAASDEMKEVRIENIFRSMRLCYLSAVPVRYRGEHLSMLYPLDLLGATASTEVRLKVMRTITKVAKAPHKVHIARLLQNLAEISTICYLENHRIRAKCGFDLALWNRFGEFCLSALSDSFTASQSSIMEWLQTILGSSDGGWLIPLFEQMLR